MLRLFRVKVVLVAHSNQLFKFPNNDFFRSIVHVIHPLQMRTHNHRKSH